MVYITDLGLGRQKIFWNVHLIIDDDINLIVKDKDMFFDDLIGNAIIDKPKVRQIKDEVLEVSLVS